MKSPLQLLQQVNFEFFRSRKNASQLDLRGRFHVEHIRNKLVIGVYDIHNDITNLAKNAILDAMFHSGTQYTTWYVGLIDGTMTESVSDTYSSHAGWTEFTGYTISSSNTVRATWGVGAASSQANTNASPMVFDITSATTIKGIMVVAGENAQTKGNATSPGSPVNLLWSTAAFASPYVPVVSSDQFKLTYGVSA